MAESKIYLQEGVKMQETYTFSRALHMMRYGGKKMKPENEKSNTFFFIDGDNFKIKLENGRTRNLMESDMGNLFYLADIMCSWVEVKD